jgi:drug/metabolite transporter (DMT)-like permease
MEKYLWLIYALAAGLCWGTYVPLITHGGQELKSRYGAFLCVGIAYVLIAVLFPLARFYMVGTEKLEINATGVTFACLAGAAGALGALCVIFASLAAPPGKNYALYIAPIIFGLAPLLNTVVSMFWHPKQGAFSFGLPEQMPGWMFYVGVVLVGLGSALVLLSKPEEATNPKTAASPGAAVVADASGGSASPSITSN